VKARPALIAAGAALVAAGCGQKGPLYLPDKNAAVVTSPAAPSAPPGTAPKKSDPDADSQPPK
jgi:predicted small lipoprotein YifL